MRSLLQVIIPPPYTVVVLPSAATVVLMRPYCSAYWLHCPAYWLTDSQCLALQEASVMIQRPAQYVHVGCK